MQYLWNAICINSEKENIDLQVESKNKNSKNKSLKQVFLEQV